MNLHDNVRWIKTWLYVFFSSAVVTLHFAFQHVKEMITSTSARSTGRCENGFLLISMTKIPLRSTVTHQCVHLTQYGLCTVLLLCPNTLLMFVISVHSAVCVCLCMFFPFAFVWWAAARECKLWFFWSPFLSFACSVSMLAAREEERII